MSRPAAPSLPPMPPLITRDEALELGALTDHAEIETLVERAWDARHRAVRRRHRPLLAGQRQVRRLRRGLRLLRTVAVRRGRDADARDDGARADPRARTRRRGRRRPPLLHGHPGPGPLQARLREDPRRRPARRRAHEPQALRVGRPHERRPREVAQGSRHPARPPQRRDRGVLLPRGLEHGPLRGPAAHHRRRPRGRPRDVRRRHPEPRRVARAARRDGVRARIDQPDVGSDQPAEPAPRHEVRRPRLHGSVGGREVDRDLPPDPARRRSSGSAAAASRTSATCSRSPSRPASTAS